MGFVKLFLLKTRYMSSASRAKTKITRTVNPTKQQPPLQITKTKTKKKKQQLKDKQNKIKLNKQKKKKTQWNHRQYFILNHICEGLIISSGTLNNQNIMSHKFITKIYNIEKNQVWLTMLRDWLILTASQPV